MHYKVFGIFVAMLAAALALYYELQANYAMSQTTALIFLVFIFVVFSMGGYLVMTKLKEWD